MDKHVDALNREPRSLSFAIGFVCGAFIVASLVWGYVAMLAR